MPPVWCITIYVSCVWFSHPQAAAFAWQGSRYGLMVYSKLYLRQWHVIHPLTVNLWQFNVWTSVCLILPRHDLNFLSTAGCCIPFSLPWRCPLCNEGKIILSPMESARIVVNLRGKCLSYSLECLCTLLPEDMNLKCLWTLPVWAFHVRACMVYC